MEADRIEISTPEGLTLEMTLAGLGSRAAAAIIDTLIIVVLALVVIWPLPDDVTPLVRIFQIAAPVLLFFGYHMVFETMGRRQSPGKRALGLRVVGADGSPVGGVATLIRNLIRLVDFLPSLYLVGIIAVFATTRNQRLGDLAAGVVVVTEPRMDAEPVDDLPSFYDLPEGWDVSAVTDEDLAMIRRFLARRYEMDRGARLNLAHKLAFSVEKRVSRPPGGSDPERLLETVFELKKQRD